MRKVSVSCETVRQRGQLRKGMKMDVLHVDCDTCVARGIACSDRAPRCLRRCGGSRPRRAGRAEGAGRIGISAAAPADSWRSPGPRRAGAVGLAGLRVRSSAAPGIRHQCAPPDQRLAAFSSVDIRPGIPLSSALRVDAARRLATTGIHPDDAHKHRIPGAGHLLTKYRRS
jgi:hypothetical protein